MKLKDQLYNSLPAGRFAFSALLRLLDVVETCAIPTAAVECKRLPRLLINPDFVAEHANTPDKLAMLVLHELHHVLLGHTKRFVLNDPLDNFVFDCVINAMLCRLLPNPANTALFTDFYSDDQFPECMLRPPVDWQPEYASQVVPPALGKGRNFPGIVAARAVYKSLYSIEGATYEDIRNLFPKALNSTLGLLAGIPLLGEHRGEQNGSADDATIAVALDGVLPGDRKGGSSMDASAEAGGKSGTHDGDDSPLAKATLVSAIRAVIAQWPCPPEPFKGQSLDGLLGESHVQIQGRRHDRQTLRRLFRRVADLHLGDSQRVSGLEDRHIQSPVRTSRLSRKDVVGHLLGHKPLLLDSEVTQRVMVRQGTRVHVYLDVSGSIEGIKGILYGAVLEHQECVWPQIHLFSTEVADVSLQQLRQGICKTTGGTDINCVFQHARKHGVQRALIITDGYVGSPSDRNAAWARKMKVAVAYTPGHSKNDLAPYARHAEVLHLGGAC